jgi:hypothetical protein
VEAWNVVASISAAVAALAALGALIAAWKTLQEGRDTIAELKKLQVATQAEADAARETTKAAQETTRALHFILTEARLTREIDALRGVAAQLATFIAAMRAVADSGGNSFWREFHDVKAVLASEIAAVAPVELPHAAKLADPSSDPRIDNSSDQEQAKVEIRKAIEAAATRLADARRAAN